MSEEKRLIFHRGMRYAIQAKRISFTPPKLLSFPATSTIPLALSENAIRDRHSKVIDFQKAGRRYFWRGGRIAFFVFKIFSIAFHSLDKN